MIEGDDLFLVHMLQYGRRIPQYTAGGREEFFRNPMVQDAVIRNFEVIGEAATRISPGFRAAHSELPWKAVIGFRNVLIHGYTTINLVRVWNAVESDLPLLLPALEALLRDRGVDPDAHGDG